ncbi:cell envelope biogenesis protein TolA [Streptomonospora nanhaiensis]|uniref:Cell envelope biogenesis protein TolA n=1 Tax=Streptomonospora nanhaiensis TaxID=1323731 RepID=A0ABY6YFD8_9ACTN|nr:cell envelope biogenesis protein TolA [Streptomonospora nanhaiensis]WAE70945.1 cell envelope biogenesis protein TolA [Streptomonospora nanhaiensis]
MKFELVDPPEQPPTPGELPGPSAASQDRQEQAASSSAPEHPDALLPPVRERMNTAVEGVRASLDQLRARVADKSMAEAARAAAQVRDADAGTAFHPHRFTARTQAGER